MTAANLDVAGTGISLGLTLYSLTNEWWSRAYDLESLVAEVTRREVGPGVEIVGFQSIRSFPDVDDEFVANWRRLVDTYGIVPTCLGSNIDVALRPDRTLTVDEMVDYLDRQLATAAKLGFRTVRIQIGASPDVLRRCLPTAERFGITMGMEIHAPESSLTPTILKVREFYDEVDSPLLGFIPDFSSTMRAVPAGELADLRRLGLSADQVDALVAAWRDGAGDPFERYGRWAEGARSAGAPEVALSAAMLVFTMHGRATVASWAELAGRIVHVHGKCYEFDADGDEPSIDYAGIGEVLVGAGFRGWVSTEWEGHAFTLPSEADGFERVAAQQALLRRSLAAAAGRRA